MTLLNNAVKKRLITSSVDGKLIVHIQYRFAGDN
jgi:hypothetical protein